MEFSSSQDLNDWVVMLDHIYGPTQNFNKTKYELLSHLTEVVGAFSKLAIKRRNATAAQQFVPKIFGWAAALLMKVKHGTADVEDAIIRKYPGVCHYCTHSPCDCWNGPRPPVNEKALLALYLRNVKRIRKRSPDDFLVMFSRIYQDSWCPEDASPGTDAVWESLNTIYTRLTEELSELAEAMRFHHLHPSNFDNEFADFMAWWFALVSTTSRALDDNEQDLSCEELLWRAYPGYCRICGLHRCDCRSGPVRELLSKPALSDLVHIDGLTQANNQASYKETLKDVARGKYPLATPVACIRIDIDSFKEINDTYSHDVGDAILTTLVTVLRQKIRPRDRLFRVGGDEFAILCQDFSELEAQGMMSRAVEGVTSAPVDAAGPEGERALLAPTLSIGIARCNDATEIGDAFERADHAAMESKRQGKNQITIFKNTPSNRRKGEATPKS